MGFSKNRNIKLCDRSQEGTLPGIYLREKQTATQRAFHLFSSSSLRVFGDSSFFFFNLEKRKEKNT